MRDSELRRIRARLLQGGVAPKHVKRTLKELGHHFADLERQARSDGLSPQEASARAAERLGDHEKIIAEALSRPELKSWAHRCPWGVYGIVPVVALFAAAIASMFMAVGILTLAETNSGLSPAGFANALFEHWWIGALLEGWRVGTVYLLPALFAAGLAVLAARREAPILWPSVGVVLILLLGCCYDVHIVPPAGPDDLAELGASITFGTGWLVSPRVFRLLIPAALVLGSFYWWRQRQLSASLAETAHVI